MKAYVTNNDLKKKGVLFGLYEDQFFLLGGFGGVFLLVIMVGDNFGIPGFLMKPIGYIGGISITMAYILLRFVINKKYDNNIIAKRTCFFKQPKIIHPVSLRHFRVRTNGKRTNQTRAGIR